MNRLWRRYPFLSRHESRWRYAQGDSPLTPRLVQFALQDSSLAAASLVALTEKLEPVLQDFREGRLDRNDSRREFDRILSDVRKLSKKIRGDHYLSYIDQRPTVKIQPRRKAVSWDELGALITELRQMAVQMREGIVSFYKSDLTRVVNVSDLNQPSFKSISKGIDKLAKTIEKSVDRL